MRRIGPLLILLLIMGAAGWYLLPSHKTPAEQRPLSDLNDLSLPRLKADFNASSAGLRIVLLLSPT
ncbi:MAG: hypothetical protein ACR2IV_20510 [Bryobacteraceae bacterium]